MQWVAPVISGVKAVNSIANGDVGGALLNGASALSGAGKKTASSSSASANPVTTPADGAVSPGLNSIPDNLPDMGTRYVDNQMQSPGFISSLIGMGGNGYTLPANDKARYDELLAQYGLTDMDWTTRQRKNGLTGGI